MRRVSTEPPRGVLPRRSTVREAAALRDSRGRALLAVVLFREPVLVDRLEARLELLHADAPIVGARRRRGYWVPGEPTRVLLYDSTGLAGVVATDLLGRFALEEEPPLRLALDRAGEHLVIVGDGAAFDGSALATVAGALSGGPTVALLPQVGEQDGAGGSAATASWRPAAWCPLLAVLAPTPGLERDHPEGLATADVAGIPPAGERSVTARLAAAAGGAVRDRSAARSLLGVTVALGGPPAVGNHTVYRRIDLRPGADIGAAVDAMLDRPARPLARVSTGERKTESILVANLGRLVLPGVRRFEFYPLALGRFPVAVGAATVAGGNAALTVRARDLSSQDAQALVADIAARLAQ